VSSILTFRRETLPTLQYFHNDTELALDMTLLKLHYILQVFCVRQEDRGGGASDKSKSTGEDPKATGGLVSNLPHPRVNKTKSHCASMGVFRFSAALIEWSESELNDVK